MIFTVNQLIPGINKIIPSGLFIFHIDIPCLYRFVTAVIISFNTIGIQISRIIFTVSCWPVSILNAVIIIQKTYSTVGII